MEKIYKLGLESIKKISNISKQIGNDFVEEYKKLMVVHNYKDDLTEISNKDRVQDLLDRAVEHRKNNITMPPIQSRLTPEEQETHRKTLEKVIEEMING